MRQNYDGNLHFLAQHENATYSPVEYECAMCGDDICRGDRRWRINGELLCADCVNAAEEVAETWEPE